MWNHSCYTFERVNSLATVVKTFCCSRAIAGGITTQRGASTAETIIKSY